MALRAGSGGTTELEVALVFGAFIAVTSLFSCLSLGAGAASLPGVSDAGYPVVAAGSPCLEAVLEIRGADDPHIPSAFVDTLTLTVAPTDAGAPVDMTQATVTVMMPHDLETLTYSAAAVPESGAWTIADQANGNGDAVLEAGETFTLLIRLPSPLVDGSNVRVVIRPEGAGPTFVTWTVRMPAGE
jgi:archaellin